VAKIKRSKKTRKILIASGVNLDLLGSREPRIYGTDTLKDMESLVKKNLAALQRSSKSGSYSLKFFQTNDEAKFLAEISKDYAGAVINAGAWTHTSLAIADRLVGLGLVFVEAHVSDTSKREPFREHSYLAGHAEAVVQGHGIESYWFALKELLAVLESRPL
jgi:3-dehydroquinate dehydratase-2